MIITPPCFFHSESFTRRVFASLAEEFPRFHADEQKNNGREPEGSQIIRRIDFQEIRTNAEKSKFAQGVTRRRSGPAAAPEVSRLMTLLNFSLNGSHLLSSENQLLRVLTGAMTRADLMGWSP